MITQNRSAVRLKKARPFTLHCSLLLVIFIYAFLGGVVFNKLESGALRDYKERRHNESLECLQRVLDSQNHGLTFNETLEHTLKCWKIESDERSEWGYVTATLYGFGIVTTLGYNRIAPITTKGRLFCMLYGIVGIPLTMIIIANVGQYLREFAGNCRKKFATYKARRQDVEKAPNHVIEEDVEDASVEYSSLVLLLVFCAYIALGAWLLPLLKGKSDFINGLYYNFLCLTAMDFGQLVPQRAAFLPVTFIYVCFGLAITTIAIEVGSEYMQKLHHIGERVKNVAHTKIKFNGKTLSVMELLFAVGKKCGVEPRFIESLDLDNVVERTIAVKEGREAPPDTNDEYLPPEPSPKFEMDNVPPPPPENFPTEEGIRKPSLGSLKAFQICDGQSILPIDATPIEETVLTWHQPLIIAKPKEIVISLEDLVHVVSMPPTAEVHEHVISAEIFMPAYEQKMPAICTTLAAVNEKEPLTFEAKKEKYACHSKKLFETYREEWSRINQQNERRRSTRRDSSATNLLKLGEQKKYPSCTSLQKKSK
ncbi:hypothetical protein QR680_016401 [Steinernema hermaphroditum]|uniref:Potassium channel domain-containing protein n=1 Tax=Steinernema hermaphroditum TaxID=289476 RepID=A0AA39LME3_9BILA|nr:hypothetical protein QR680_016401 [Steinernema hermaphroditum]